MNSLSIVLFFIGFILLFLLRNRKRRVSKIDSSSFRLRVPHGPISFPLIGNLLQLGERPYEKMFKWSKKYGSVYRVKLGSQEVVVLNGTEVIREALINHSEGKTA
jgi:hypothetical protein